MAQIKISNDILDLQENEKTFFDTDAAAGLTSIDANGTNFTSGDYIVLGKLGVEKSEIVKISGTPTSSAIALATATVFAHNRGDLITFIPYNQIVLERSTNGGTSYSALAAVSIQPDNHDTIIQRPTDAATDMYRVRFYNSTTAVYSDYSDSVLATGYADNTVFSIKRRALRSLGEKIGDVITEEFLNESLWEGRRELDNQVQRWSFRTKFDQIIGTIIPGRNSVTAPADLRDPNTNNNVLALRVGRNAIVLDYQDRNRFNQNYVNIAHGKIDTAITTGSTSIILDSSGNFDESGDVSVAGEDETETIDTVAYTANNESTDTLSGVTGISANHAAQRDVWQGANFGLPRAYTIDNGEIKFDVPFADQYAGEDIGMDYYGDLVAYDSDADVLDEPEYDLFVSYLRWKIKYLKSNGTMDLKADPDYIEWLSRKKNLIEGEIIGQRIQLIPS